MNLYVNSVHMFSKKKKKKEEELVDFWPFWPSLVLIVMSLPGFLRNRLPEVARVDRSLLESVRTEAVATRGASTRVSKFSQRSARPNIYFKIELGLG